MGFWGFGVLGKNVVINGEVRIGDNCVIEEGVTFNNYIGFTGVIEIGNNCIVQKNANVFGNICMGDDSVVGLFTQINTSLAGKIKIGKDVHIGSFSIIGASLFLEIKDHCIFAPYIHIGDSSHNFDDINVPIKHSPIVSLPTYIEEDVWLGNGVMVLMGCTIGKGSVIGAKSLVNKSIPAYSIAYGTPAKVHKARI